MINLKEHLGKLKRISEYQIEALEENNLNHLFELQEQRNHLLKALYDLQERDMLQKIDTAERENLKTLLGQILELDNTLKLLIRKNMNNIVKSLVSLENIKKGFIKSTKDRSFQYQLNINI